MQLPNQWHRKRQSQEIGDYVQDCRGCGCGTEVDARVWSGDVPACMDRAALEDHHEYACQRVPKNDKCEKPSEDIEDAVDAENAAVKEQDGKLDGGYCDEVDYTDRKDELN